VLQTLGRDGSASLALPLQAFLSGLLGKELPPELDSSQGVFGRSAQDGLTIIPME
jgi:hypothetical protein